MIHTYCCTKCGQRFPGYKIAFDLVELLDIDLESELRMPAVELSDVAEKTHLDDRNQMDEKDTVKMSSDSSMSDEFVRNLMLLDAQGSLKDNSLEKNNGDLKKEISMPKYEEIHAFIDPRELEELSEKNGVYLKNNVPVSIRISLQQFLKHMTVGNGKKGHFNNIVLNDETEDKEVISLLTNLLTIGELRSNVITVAKNCWNRIREKFVRKKNNTHKRLQIIKEEKLALRNSLFLKLRINEETGNQEKAKIEKQIMALDEEIKEILSEIEKFETNPENFETTLEIIPEFFDQNKEKPDGNLYTIQYKKEGRFTYIRRELGIFRGYCSEPSCRKPILRHTGKYPHRVVGMMGAQSAGKTTMITAMNVEIRENGSLGVDSVTGAEVLYDNDAEKREKDYSLYEHGWAVSKTRGNANNTYNVSFFLTDSTRKEDKVILTLADIAGEICYNQQHDTFDKDCFKNFPLIKNCDAYVVCACIDNDGYENNDIENGEELLGIPPKAVKTIASNILSEYKGQEKIPPLCIVMTKADMVNDHKDYGNKNNDPFRIIVPESRKYMFTKELSALSSTYRITEKPSIQNSLDLCAKTYHQIRKDTYTAILSVAATGRTAMKYNFDEYSIATGRMETFKYKDGTVGRFERKRVDELWKWILKVCGVVPVHHRYKFPEIPSYYEYYSKDNSHVYNADNCLERVDALEYVAINRSNSDIDIFDANEMGIGLSERVSTRGLRLWMGKEEVEKEIRRKRILNVIPISFEQSKEINTTS